MARIRAIVFDVGGTLVYPADPVGETYARFAKSRGVKLPPEATTTAFREAMKSCSPRAKGSVPSDGNDRAWWRQVVTKSMDEKAFADPAAFDAFFEEVYLHFAKPEAWGVYPETLEVLEALRDHDVELIVLSNWDARLHSVLDGSGLGEFLPKRFISAELGWEKPDPAIYRHVAEILRQPPGSLLSVGDDPKNDVEGPKRAGWQAVQIERPKRDLWADRPGSYRPLEAVRKVGVDRVTGRIEAESRREQRAEPQLRDKRATTPEGKIPFGAARDYFSDSLQPLF